MSYKTELKTDRKNKLEAMQQLLGINKTLTNDERQRFDSLKAEVETIDARLARLKAERFDVPGTRSKRDGYEIKSNAGDGNTEGRSKEILGKDQSMRGWVARAAERGATVETLGGNRQKIEREFDENEYWGQRMGFARRGAETRSLLEDTTGSGLAITPQSWTARFINYAYPMTLLGRLGASQLAMETEIVNVPQFTAPVQPTWIAEGSSTSLDANPAFSSLVFTAKGMFYDITQYSMEMAQDAYIQGGLPGMLAASAARNYAIAIDSAGFYGVSGNTGNPGFSNETGIQLRKWGQGGASSNAAHTGTSGQAPADTQEPSSLIELVREKNIEPSGFATAPQVVSTLNRLNVPSYGKYWSMPADAAAMWANAATSTNIPVTETDPTSGIPVQTGGTMSSLYCADWGRVIIGVHLDVQTQVLRERFADQLQIGLLTYTRFSVRLSHPEGMVRSFGVLTS